MSASSKFVDQMEPSLNTKSKDIAYLNEKENDDDDDGEQSLKYSLAHYFSTTFVVFIGLLLVSTIILFIWSNTSDGAWVSLQVTPVLRSNNTDSMPLDALFAKYMDNKHDFDFSDLNDLELNLNIC